MSHTAKNAQSPVSYALVQASPSLALIKYWGKSDTQANLPATSSIAVTLSALKSETRVFAIKKSKTAPAVHDIMILDGAIQDPTRFSGYFDGLRAVFGHDWAFWGESINNFPTAAGLASSSSGFAALTYAAAVASGHRNCETEILSSLARLGSGSAARSLFGGFTLLPANSESATTLHDAQFWPDLRVIIVRLQDGPKEISSRVAMEQTRHTSPFYENWVLDSRTVCIEAQEHLAARNLDALGQCMRKSYLRMFSTMFSADPPIIYWQPTSLGVIKLCQTLRDQGIPAWETMDAGPQVKIFTTESHVQQIITALSTKLSINQVLVDHVGTGPALLSKPELLGQPADLLTETASRHGLQLSHAEHIR